MTVYTTCRVNASDLEARRRRTDKASGFASPMSTAASVPMRLILSVVRIICATGGEQRAGKKKQLQSFLP
jgi:hypothetical protein